MKAIPFLEWFNNTDIVFNGGRIANFYSQPFKPEMITELFEGWIKEDNPLNYKLPIGRFCRINGKNDLGEENYEYITIHFATDTKDKFMFGFGLPIGGGIFGSLRYFKASNLDHFISDCNRAGIELEWKPEIIKQYFS